MVAVLAGDARRLLRTPARSSRGPPYRPGPGGPRARGPSRGIPRPCGDRPPRVSPGSGGRPRPRSRARSGGSGPAWPGPRPTRRASWPAKRRSKTEPGVDLLGHRRRVRPPRDVRRIGAAVARVAVARLRRRGRSPAPATGAGWPRRGRLGGHLIDRNPGLDPQPRGFQRVRAGQEAGHRPGVVPRAVAVVAGPVLRSGRRGPAGHRGTRPGAAGSGQVANCRPAPAGVQAGMWTPFGT